MISNHHRRECICLQLSFKVIIEMALAFAAMFSNTCDQLEKSMSVICSKKWSWLANLLIHVEYIETVLAFAAMFSNTHYQHALMTFCMSWCV